MAVLPQLEEHEKLHLRSRNDPALHPLIDAGGDAERQCAVETLILRVAKPVISGILANKRGRTLRNEELDDIGATVTLRLVRRLQNVPFEEKASISNFEDYVARLTYNLVYDILRQRFPQRTRLKNRLQYVLTRDKRFLTWVVNGMTVAGLTEWGEREAIRGPGMIRQEADDRMLDRNNTAGALQALLLRFGKPLALNDLTTILGDLWGIGDEYTPMPVDTTSGSTPLRELETRQHLTSLWAEIQALPAGQRTALLLNLRDAEGLNALAIFVMMGTTTLEGMAASLEMTNQELAAIWSELPIDDLTIAAKLGITRQQVINLRKSARERLSRRMKKKGQWEP